MNTNTPVASLPAKWRKVAATTIGTRQENDACSAYDDALGRCADELEAALASPAPSAGVVDEAMVERGLEAARVASDARLPRYSVVRAILTAALQHPAAPSVEDQP